ncbi:MAG: cyanophycinase [Planctomycetota bacterium]
MRRIPVMRGIILAVFIASPGVLSGQATKPLFADNATPKLVIAGGGSLPSSIFERFRQLAGPNPKLVYIPTASERPTVKQSLDELWETRGFDEVIVLNESDPKVISSDEFLKPLREATAVWFGGGSQQRIADAYLNTPVEKELQKLIARGGVIGGTSAGAAIQSRVMIASGRSEPSLSTGFDLLRGVIIDQHFLRRNRLSRLRIAVSRHPDRIGFGIDEGTAIVVKGDQAEVVGRSYVLRLEMEADQLQIDIFNEGEQLRLSKDQ